MKEPPKKNASLQQILQKNGKFPNKHDAEEKKSSTQIADATKADSGKKNTVKL